MTLKAVKDIVFLDLLHVCVQNKQAKWLSLLSWIKKRRKINRAAAFTLIELLIVVAIISILSSIAVPNFLEAQTRAKVSRVKADMKSMATALEIYATDHNKYPYRRHPAWEAGNYAPMLDTRLEDLKVLTTPVAYVTQLFPDVFETRVPYPGNIIDYFDPEQTNVLASTIQGEEVAVKLWLLVSVGPDGYIGVSKNGVPGGYPASQLSNFTITMEYNANRGTISSGNIYRLQGNADFGKQIRGQ